MSLLKDYWAAKKKQLFAGNEEGWMKEVRERMDAGEVNCEVCVDSRAELTWLRDWTDRHGLEFQPFPDAQEEGAIISWDF